MNDLAQPIPVAIQRRPLPVRLLAVVVAVLLMSATVALLDSDHDAHAAHPRDAHPARSLTGDQAPCPWLDSKLPVATRVDQLLRAMTPLQEATMLHLLSVPTTSTTYQGHTPAIPAVCIPEITEQDGAAGVATGYTNVARVFPDVTQLPAPIADAAAFDPSLAHLYGDVIGSEDAAKGIDVALSPTINIDRSPLWGRSYETLGEDPFLTATLAVQLVQGIQQNRVVSNLKHFAVYNQETARATAADDAVVSERTMHEIYLPAFSASVQQGHVGSIMCSYNLINGVPACQDANLLDTILRGQWHFDGFVRSDCGSIYNQAQAMAVGVSQVKCTPLYGPQQLAAAVAEGRLARSELDGLARPLLTVLFHYDLIANPHPLNPSRLATTAAHRAVAEQTDAEGSVLLKNVGNLLPLDFAHLPSLALIGPDGGTPMPAGFGAMHVTPTGPVSAQAALAAALGPRLRFYAGSDAKSAAALARRSSVAVIVVHDVEVERHDRTTLTLPGNQDALVAAVAAANPHTIVVLETGAGVLMPWLKAVPAILETWYPGETAGTALAGILSGKIDPSGKLPVTFPAAQTAAAMPDATAASFGGVQGKVDYADGIDVGYRWYQVNGVTPLFAFGYGLSYTTFQFSGLSVSTTSGGGLQVTATVTNSGPAAGSDVVQCYLGLPTDPGAAGGLPGSGQEEAPRQLKGFTRVSLAPKQSKTVHLTLTPGDLAVWSNTPGQGWVVPAGTFHVAVGDGSDLANLPLTTTVSLPGASLGVNSGPASI